MRNLLVLLCVALPLQAGLRAPVTVIRDKWGVPHIYAKNQHDLFYAQGFVQAQDRMYQMEIWKRAGQGRLAEIFGPSFVGRDIAARKLRYRGPMKAEYESYAPDALSILEAFTEGINAFIDSHRINPPAEFAVAGFKPEHWKPEDCVQRLAAYGLMSNATMELRIARLVAELGAVKTTGIVAPRPFAKVDPVPSIDYASLDPEMLRDFIGSDIRIEVPPPGSNNWVVSGSMTTTGKPFLANDPHRTLSIPSLRYVVHLVAPGWNVIGATEPALPGVAIGHNEEIAWGITVFGADQQDLYVETLRDGQYKTENGWRPLRVVHETINVKGAASVDVSLEFTRHGPVIWKKGDRGVALRWVGSEPGTAGYLGSLAVDRAPRLDRVPARVARLESSRREHRLRRSRRSHRRTVGGADTGSIVDGASARRRQQRQVRVARVHPARTITALTGPAAWIHRYREQSDVVERRSAAHCA